MKDDQLPSIEEAYDEDDKALRYMASMLRDLGKIAKIKNQSNLAHLLALAEWAARNPESHS